jgi:hypothetical protein
VVVPSLLHARRCKRLFSEQLRTTNTLPT